MWCRMCYPRPPMDVGVVGVSPTVRTPRVMPPTDLLHTLWRRWYLVLVGLVVTAGLVVVTLLRVPVGYTARADVLLLPPKTPGSDNPYLGLSDLQGVAATITRSILDDAAVQTLARQGVTSGYTITVDITTSAPLLLAKANGNTPTAAINAMQHVAALVAPTLAELQQAQHVPTQYQITATTIHADKTPTAITKTRTRVLLVAIVAGLLFTVLLAVGTDRYLLRRTRRRNTDTAAGEQLPPSASGPHAPPSYVSPAAPGPDLVRTRTRLVPHRPRLNRPGTRANSQ
jgi:capsular polysaccharide biosynthesis protein